MREEHGREAVGPFYEAVSSAIFDLPPEETEDGAGRGRPEFVLPVLESLGLPSALWAQQANAEAHPLVMSADLFVSSDCRPLPPPKTYGQIKESALLYETKPQRILKRQP